MKRRRTTAAALLILLLVLGGLYFGDSQNSAPLLLQGDQTTTLNRRPARLQLSKHARCRMDCRQISREEVQDILSKGHINWAKSEVTTKDNCRKRYALEGKTNDGQQVRIIFASCGEETTVITVIDLGQEWTCHCN